MSEKQFEETGDMCIYHNGRWKFDDKKRIVDTITDLDKRLAPIVVEMLYSKDGGEVYQMDRTSVLHLLNQLWEENRELRQQVQNAKELAVENDVQYQICRKEKEDFQNMCEQLRHELDSLSGCYCADNKEFKDYWRIGYDD